MEIDGDLTCDTDKNGQNFVGATRPRVWLKNTGEAEAVHVFIGVNEHPRLVPLKNFVDTLQITDDTCQKQIVPDSNYMSFPISAGQEFPFNALYFAGGGTKPGFGKGVTVEVIWPWCFGYSDEYGIDHASCTTYVFVPSTSATNYSPWMHCDGSEVSGIFELSLNGHCEN